MANAIYTPSKEELEARIGRFDALAPMTTANDLAWIPQGAMDVVFARKIMPVILHDKDKLFGKAAPIIGASGVSTFISIMPPGQGPCLHSHNTTHETFMVLQGTIEYEIGEPVAHRVVLNKWDTLSVPPLVYRGFRNVGTVDAVQLTIISGLTEGKDAVSVPKSVDTQLQTQYGEEVAAAFRKLVPVD
ncbi:MAG: cupin domain-containing protein [Betaproteobacteria bacterium]|nr:cupin domain-containing protein [Betaproteobacteria bacterium]